MKSRQMCLALLAVGLLPLAGVSPRLAAKDPDAADLYDQVVKSCVFIITPAKGGHAEGSGSLIDMDQKLVLTNYHVVAEEEQVFIQFPVYVKGELLTDKEAYKQRIPRGLAIKGQVLFRDKARDLAVVKLESVPADARQITLAKTSPRTNASVWQIGNAGAVKQVFRVSKGEVSGVGHEKFRVGGEGSDDTFEVNATMITATNPINPGDSGGPLFDKHGHQVGVTESTSTSAKLVSHFVDVTEVRALLAERKIKIKEPSDKAAPPTKTTPVPADPVKNAVEIAPPPKKDAVVVPVPKKDDTPAASPAEERAAADKLRSARLFRDGDDNRPTYIAKLTEIVKKWPTTAAGKEAKKLLHDLK